MGRDVSVGIATRYGLDGPGIESADFSGGAVCGLSHAGVAGSNPADGMDVDDTCIVKLRQKGKAWTIRTKR